MYPTVADLHASKPVTLTSLAQMKSEGEKIACLTAYDASFAAVQDRAGVDVVLVGDSLGMVVQGLNSTVPVTVADTVYHCQAVARGLHRAFLIADLPFMSYATLEDAVKNTATLMQAGGAQMVKLEANALQAEIVEYLSARGVPVCAHLGLRPQSIHKFGGYRVQGREVEAADAMRHDAEVLEAAGADLLLLECVPGELAAEISAAAKVPVIGIGAGSDTDGQILVMHDVLGVSSYAPKFVRNFMDGAPNISAAFSAYVEAVKAGTFPAQAETLA